MKSKHAPLKTLLKLDASLVDINQETLYSSLDEVLNYAGSTAVLNNLKSYTITRNVLLSKTIEHFNNCFFTVLETVEDKSKLLKITTKTEFIELYYGIDSEEYKKKLSTNKSYASCSIEMFRQNNPLLSESELKHQFNLKYGSGKEALKLRHNLSDEESKNLFDSRINAMKETVANYTDEQLAIISNKKSISLESCINRHGIKKGTEVYNDRIEKYKYSRTLQGCIDRFGLTEGTKRYESYSHVYITKQFWLNRGYTEEQAENQLKSIFENRNRFSKDTYIEKYGKDQYIKLIESRNLIKTSKAAIDFFNDLTKMLIDLNIVEDSDCIYTKDQSNVNEIIFVDDHNNVFPTDFICNKLMIAVEHSGPFWHPRQGQTDWTNPIRNLVYDDVGPKDKLKDEYLQSLGYKTFTVWSDENQDNQLNQIIDYVLEEFNLN